MDYSIIINCYNTLALMKQCIQAALETTGSNTEIILINNHPPTKQAQEYLKQLHHPRLRILDPGKNLGCNLGFIYGAKQAKGKYLVKLDDDIIVPRNNWIEMMAKALQEVPDLAFVGLTPSDIRKNKVESRIAKPEYTLECTKMVLFCCVMMKYSNWRKHFQTPAKYGLYGYDDVYCARKAKKLGLRIAYLASHVCQHLRRTNEADPLYRLWKNHYAHREKTRLDYPTWRQLYLKAHSDMPNSKSKEKIPMRYTKL